MSADEISAAREIRKAPRGAFLIYWKKVAEALFQTAASLPPAKGVAFAGCVVTKS
jgi:hypothetical protein